MKKIETMDEIKKVELETLSAVDGFCKEKGLQYTLYYGTLLGAVRHGGFIPWDDDVDIAMPRADYEIFLRDFRNERYKIATYANKKGYIYPFAKVYDDTTILDEHMNISCELGIGIDVFPIDGIDNDEAVLQKKVSKISYYKKIISGKLFWLTGISRTKRLIIRFVSKFYNGKKVAQKIDHIGRMLSITQCDRAGVIVFGNPKINFMPKEWLNQTIIISFEGRDFVAPKNYDEVLTRFYGDYMKIPPESERNSSHHFDAWYR